MIDGKRLRDLRNNLKITAEELGRVVGVSKHQILRYENNKTDVTSDVLIKLADFFDVSTDYLLGRADSQIAYQRKSVFTWSINAERLLKIFTPEVVGRLVKSLGFEVRIEGLHDTGRKALVIEIPESPGDS